jgi:DNA-binding NtrC family response regulator
MLRTVSLEIELNLCAVNFALGSTSGFCPDWGHVALDQPRDEDTILLASGEPATLKAAFEMLQLEGYKVLGCTNLKCMGCILAAVSPQIVMFDYHLPDGDAGQFLANAKRANPQIKCIVLTDAGHFDQVARATRDLAELVISKPLEEMAFRTFVRACRESLQSRRKAARG